MDNYSMNTGIPQPQEPKKSNKGVIIGIIIGAVALFLIAAVCTAAVVAKFVIGGSPEVKVKKGIANMAAEMVAYRIPVFDDIDFEAVRDMQEEEVIHTNFDLSLTLPEGTDAGINNVSLIIDALRDSENERAEYGIKAGAYGIDVSLGNIITDEDTAYIQIPMMFDDTYRIELDELARKFNNSAWSKLLDTELPEDLSIKLFEDKEIENSQKIAEEFVDFVKKTRRAFAESSSYAVIKDKKDFDSGIRVTIDNDDINKYFSGLKDDIYESAFYKEYMDQLYERTKYAVSADTLNPDEVKEASDKVIEAFTSLRLENDFVLDFYFDKKGRIVNISTPGDVKLKTPDGYAFAIDISFSGEERSLDNISGGIYVKDSSDNAGADGIAYFGIERDAYLDDNVFNEDFEILLQSGSHDSDIAIKYKNDWDYEDNSYDMVLSAENGDEEISFKADGDFTDIVKGKEYTFRMNNAALSVNYEDLLIMSAVISLEPSDKKINIPENTVDLMGMSEQEIQQLLIGAVSSLQNLGNGVFN